MNVKRWLGPLSLLGGISALLLLVALASTGWGEPGTAAYQTYETLRLSAFALLLIVPGWLGLFLALSRGYSRWGPLASGWRPMTTDSRGVPRSELETEQAFFETSGPA